MPLEGDLDLAPVYRRLSHPGAGYTDTDAFGPFIGYVSAGDRTQLAVRPLFVTEERPWAESIHGERERVVSFIPPFGKYHTNPRTTQFRFWPLVWYTKTRTGPGGLDSDFLLFPILMFGRTTPPPLALAAGERPDSYFALFPLAGQINSFVAYDRFQFLAWPLLQRLTKRVYGDEENFNSIALLIGWTTGPPRGGSWHVLPFYSRSQWIYPPHRAPKYPAGADPAEPLPRYIKEIYLWPFVHRQTLNMDAGPGQETRLFAVWPFFKHEKGYDHEFWTFLWPFFRWNREYPLARESGRNKELVEAEGEEAYAEENTNVLYDVLTQAVWRYHRTRSYERRRLLIFLYADYQTLHEGMPVTRPDDPADMQDYDYLHSLAFLQPIGFWRRTAQEMGVDGGYRDRSYYVLVPFFQTHTRNHLDALARETGARDRFTRLWPLFSFEWNADGSRDVHVFTLLPLRIEKYVEDFLEAWGVFVNLYRYERAQDAAGGATRHTVFMNLVKTYHDARESTVSIPILFTSRTVRDGPVVRFSRHTLFGLFGWEGSDGPDGPSRTLRLFGFPLRID